MDIQFVITVVFSLVTTQADICLDGQHCSNCTSSTKYCVTACITGYFGLKCKSRCSKNCKNRECSQDQNGVPTCSQGCDPGFYGTQCNIPCPSPTGNCTKCPQGCDGRSCDLNSSCVSGCPDLYYGSNCKTCSHRCRSCNKITGSCDKCHDPYSGQDCQFSCENCSTIDCVQTCAPGLYGRKCSKKCSKNCQAYLAANKSLTSTSSNSCISECQRQSGECINGCLGDWIGPSCSSKVKCNLNCMGCNDTSACVDGCSSGYYGDDCKSCSENCFNRTCHPKNGSCDIGCIRGFHGQFCKESCTDCPEGACHQRTGICAGHKDQGSIIGATIGTSTALVILICGVVVTILFVNCKRSAANRIQNGAEPMHTEGSRQEERLEYYALHRYWEIDDYDEASHPQGQQQGPAGEDDYDEVSQQRGPAGEDDYDEVFQRQGPQRGPAGEDNSSDSTASVLAAHFPGDRRTENDKNDPANHVPVDYIPKAQGTDQQNGASALSVLDNFPETQTTEDISDDTSRSSTNGSLSHTHSFRDVFVDDPRTVVTYITPTRDNNQEETGTHSQNL